MTHSTEPPYALTAPPAPDTPPLAGAVTADVALVGGGYGGLLTAIHLAERGARVVLVEAREIGHGGSGRNHGQCIPIFRYLDPDRLPPAGFDLLLNAGQRVFDTIARFGIACEPVQKGTLTAAYNPRSLALTRAAQAKYARWGKASPWLGAEEVAALTGNRAFSGGWYHPDGGHVNPLAYARGLARAAQGLGVALHTQTPMTALSRRDGRWHLRTPGGEVVAATVGLATDAYSTAGVPARAVAGFFPMQSYALASRPLTAEERAQVMPSGMNFGDTHHDPMFFRIDAAGRIITGGLVEARRGRDFAHSAGFMTRRLARLYPVLEGLGWDHLWQGTISMALDQTPSIRRLDEGLWSLAGWSGRGVPTSAALSEAFARTLLSPAEGALVWPATDPSPVLARRLLGALVQTFRGPINKTRDRLEG